jgi:hypothetical protein
MLHSGCKCPRCFCRSRRTVALTATALLFSLSLSNITTPLYYRDTVITLATSVVATAMVTVEKEAADVPGAMVREAMAANAPAMEAADRAPLTMPMKAVEREATAADAPAI